MNQMFEIYNNYADLYDELVNHEDYNNNLKIFLNDHIVWNDKSVYEFGVGTGRVTKNYIDKVGRAVLCDNSEHMIEKCKNNLSFAKDRINYLCIDHKDISKITEKLDIVIEGWSFGHLIVNEKNDKDFWIREIIDESIRIANEKIIIIETLGTNVDKPTPPGEVLPYFYEKLEINGFKKNIIESDYKFTDYKEASRIMGAFFGDNMKNSILSNKSKIIKEYTGIWILNI